MKKLALSVIAILSISLASNGQAFEKGGKYISLGLGGANFWHISANGYFEVQASIDMAGGQDTLLNLTYPLA